MKVKVINSGPDTGVTNMGTDREIMEEITAEPSYAVLRWYTWQPAAFSLGYGQKVENLFDTDLLKSQKIDCCKRPTGGSVVYHSGDLSYSLTIPRDNPWEVCTGSDLYRFVNGAFVKALEELGIPASVPAETPSAQDVSPEIRNLCLAFHSPGDILLNGKKLGGSAQRRLRKVWQQQGFIMFSPLEVPSCFLNPQSAFLMKSQSTDLFSSGYSFDIGDVRNRLAQSLLARCEECIQ